MNAIQQCATVLACRHSFMLFPDHLFLGRYSITWIQQPLFYRILCEAMWHRYNVCG